MKEDKLKTLGLTAVSAVLTVLAIELFFEFFPRFIPANILLQMSNYKVATAYGKVPEALTERLKDSPWIKFKPHVTVRDVRTPLEVSTFVSEWSTDSLGFKNDEGLLKGKKVMAVAMGDSHVEAFGVSSNQTMTGVLTRVYDIPTYNLGVEAYGPQQALGAFVKYGLGLSPRFAFLIFNGSSFLRSTVLSKGRFVGKTGPVLMRLDELRRNRSVLSDSFFVAGLRALNYEYNFRITVPPGDVVPYSVFRSYLRDYLQRDLKKAYGPREDQETASAMTLTQEIILEFVRRARENKILPFVVVYPTSKYLVEVAYPEDYQSQMAGTLTGLEYAANDEILQFSRSRGIGVIDAVSPMRQYLRDKFILVKDGTVDFKELPFFKVDGHPSPVAHGIYARAIQDSLRKDGLLPVASACELSCG